MFKQDGSLPPSPSWRNVLHPDQRRLSMQYRRAREDCDDTGLSRQSEHSRPPPLAWSFISPQLTENVYRQTATNAVGSGLFLHPGSLSENAIQNLNKAVSTSSASTNHPPPFLTVVLINLAKVLPQYCKLLAEPSYASVSQACAVLDCVVATASGSPSHSPMSGKTASSPVRSSSPFHYWMSSSSDSSKKHMPTSSAMALEGEWETFASPFLLLAGAEVLNAGLEHLRTPLPLPDKSNKNHTKTTGTLSSQAASLTGLYQRVKQDLLRTQDVLCEPFLRSAADPPHASRTAPFATSANTVPHIYFQTANSLASSIQRIVLFLDVRCQLVDLQAALFHVGRGATAGAATDGIAVDKEVEATSVPSLTEAAVAVTLFLQTVTTATANSFGTNDRDLFAASNNMDDDDTKEAEPTDSLAVEPILNNLILELKAWKYCFETCVALEQSQFMESIVSFRQWQLHLPSNTLETKLTLWMHVSFQEIQSLLPIYFDRVHAFATPFYGFDTDALWQRQESTTSSSAPHNYHHPHNRTDSNVTITDFLRRQEKLGGPPTAVAVVLDAVATSNLHVERGFRLASAEAEFKNEEDARVLWPAVYLRSTLHLASSLSSSANTRHSPHSSGVFRSSHNSLLSGWSHGANNTLATNIMTAGNSPSGKADRKQSILSSSPASSQRNISVYQHHQSMLEYAPDTGQAMSWPHNDWESLVASLDKNADAQKALSSDTQHNRFEDKSAFDEDEAGAVATVVDEGTSLFPELPVPVTKPTIDGFRKKHGRYSTFHTVALSEWLNLVVMVKDEEEESRWHRRRNRLDDEEVHSFVSDVLAKKLCVSSIFSAESVISLRKKVKHEPSLSLPYNFAVTWANEKQVQDFLGDVKEFFGLRPVSPLAKDSTRSYNFYSTGNTSPRTPASRRSVILRSGLKYRLRQSLKTVPFDDSAAILFLGPDLASLLD